MRLVVTDRVAWSVGRSVCHTSESCKNGCTDRDADWVVDLWARMGRRNHAIDVVQRCWGTLSRQPFWLSIYGVHIGATWRIQLSRPSAAAMRPYVKLLWPLVIILWWWWRYCLRLIRHSALWYVPWCVSLWNTLNNVNEMCDSANQHQSMNHLK